MLQYDVIVGPCRKVQSDRPIYLKESCVVYVFCSSARENVCNNSKKRKNS